MTSSKSRSPLREASSSGPVGEESRKQVEFEPDSTDERKGIFVRLGPAAQSALKAAKKAAKEMREEGIQGPKTYAAVLEKLLEYFDKQEFHFQKKILTGSVVNPLKEAEDLLAQLHLAQHAFETKRFYFAIKTYNSIGKDLKEADLSKELLEVCHFRLAHCWNQLALSLRAEALSVNPASVDSEPDSINRYYGLAMRSLESALGYLKKLDGGGDDLTALIKKFNMACCYSLKAQFMVESTLATSTLKKDSEAADLYGELRRDEKASKMKNEAWPSGLRNDWKRWDDGTAGNAAKDGLDWLKRIGTKTEMPSGLIPQDLLSKPESIWVVNEATGESDLLFLRTAEGWKREFSEWEKAAVKGASMALAIEDLLEESEP